MTYVTGCVAHQPELLEYLFGLLTRFRSSYYGMSGEIEELVDLLRATPETTELVHGPRVDVGVLPLTGLALDNLALVRPIRNRTTMRTRAEMTRVAAQIRQVVDRIPQRTYRVSNFFDRWRTRRLARRAAFL